MNKFIGKLCGIFIAALLFVGVCPAADFSKYYKQEHLSAQSGSVEADENDIRLLSDVFAGIEVAGVGSADYRLRTARQLQFDILDYKELFLHFQIQEISMFDYSPEQIDHTIGYISGGFDTGKGRIGLFWDHTCNNPATKLPDQSANNIRWNELGISYLTTGMRFGHENDGINFDDASEWLNKLNWGASFSGVWMKTENDYEYMFKMGIRDDIFRIRNHVFYALFKLNAIYSDRGTNLDHSIEAGDRIRLAKNVRLVPFVSYEHFNDWYDLDDGEDFFLAGLRLEAALGEDNSFSSLNKKSDLVDNKSQNGSAFSKTMFPLRFHVTGGYNTNLQGTLKNSRSSDLFVDLDLLEFDNNKILTLNTYAGIVTPSGAFEVLNVNYKIGPSLKIDLSDYYLRLFHSYSCLYGVDQDGVIRNYNLLGAEIAKDAQLSWLFQAAAYPTTTHFDYDAHLQASLGYDFFVKGITPYMNGSLIYLIGDDSVTGNALEAGLKIPGSLGTFVVYLRQEDSFNVFRFGEGEQRWLGFRLVF